MDDFSSDDTGPKTKTRRSAVLIKRTLAVLALLACLGFITAILYAIIDFYTSSSNVTTKPTKTEPWTPTVIATEFSTMVMYPDKNLTASDIFQYYPSANKDGLNIAFYHAANTKDDLQAALTGSAKVVEGDVSLKTSRSSAIPVMGALPGTDINYSLNEWLDAVIETNKAIKLDIKIDEAVSDVLESIKSRALHQPVWISADVVGGPGAENSHLDAESLISYVNEIYPYVSLSLGWTTDSSSSKFTWEMMNKMLAIAEKVSQKITFTCLASVVRASWPKFLWLLEQSDSFSFTVWSNHNVSVDVEDLVYFRDNLAFSRVFYEVTEMEMDNFRKAIETGTFPKMFYSGGNVLDYFRIPNAIDVTWAHRVNGLNDLTTSLTDDSILMLEADVRLYGEGTEKLNESLPVMSHDPPAINYELTLREWLEKVIEGGKIKGIKLDFKSIGAANASLYVLQDFKDSLPFPVWLNADVLRGPNSVTTPVNATAFLEIVQTMFPDVTISPGWTTTYRRVGENEPYSQEMVEEMHALCSTTRQAFTFPVRASLAKPSIKEFQWLLSQSNRYTLTIWHSTSEETTTEDLLEFYNSFPSHKVYFDIPDDMMKNLKTAINNQEKIAGLFH
ncbi:unnamed protein product [Clavelina lepadiformis]|uniref:Menorin-like domain-containing protein n=1 Tax=Clavelina lepadiformis TaxID=159417 RepID=A0ABP0FD83_CLALP